MWKRRDEMQRSRREYKTAEEVLAEQERADAKAAGLIDAGAYGGGDRAPPQPPKMTVIDMRGGQAQVVTNLARLGVGGGSAAEEAGAPSRSCSTTPPRRRPRRGGDSDDGREDSPRERHARLLRASESPGGGGGGGGRRRSDDVLLWRRRSASKWQRRCHARSSRGDVRRDADGVSG